MISKRNISIVAVGAVVAAFLVVTQTAWTNQHHGPKRLGGSFVGGLPGIQWFSIDTPLDPEGRTATIQITFPFWPEDMQDSLLAPFGADTLSVGVGEKAMVGRNTAKFTWVAYAVTDAHPPVIKAIFVANGTWDITGPDSAMSTETVNIYWPSADGNHDGLPDSNATPAASVPFPAGLNVRVPILR